MKVHYLISNPFLYNLCKIFFWDELIEFPNDNLSPKTKVQSNPSSPLVKRLNWNGKAEPINKTYTIGDKEDIIKFIKGIIKKSPFLIEYFRRQNLTKQKIIEKLDDKSEAIPGYPNNLKFLEPILESLQLTSETMVRRENRDCIGVFIGKEGKEKEISRLKEEMEILHKREIRHMGTIRELERKNYDLESQLSHMQLKNHLLQELINKSRGVCLKSLWYRK